MADIFTKSKRSDIMSKINAKDTKPEIFMRKLIFSMGYRYRLHKKELPGKPDMVFAKHKKVIFVHGCFWHGHKDCKKATVPQTNTDFWQQKIYNNIQRDKKTYRHLKEIGWDYLLIWGCQIKKKNIPELKTAVNDFFKNKDI
ncbi:DNA mismatch endonuclease Vsr [bacterium]|nr:DNA mismatch endonuclease Vsr [bacterium]